MGGFVLIMPVVLYNWDRNHGATGVSLLFDYYKLSFVRLIKDGTTDLLEEAQVLTP
jgi:hypothetical protein